MPTSLHQPGVSASSRSFAQGSQRLEAARAPLATLAVLLLLSACTATSPGPAESGRASTTPETGPVHTPTTVAELLRAADQGSPVRASELRLQAAQRLWDDGRADDASRVMARIDGSALPATSRLPWLLLAAELALDAGQPARALTFLSGPALDGVALDRPAQLRLGELRAEAYEGSRSYLASARERIFLRSLLPPASRAANDERILATLSRLPLRTLVRQAERAMTSDIRGWLSLAALAREHQDDPLQQLEAFRQWRTVWSSHPAAQQPPAAFAMLTEIVEKQPDRIALLLPLEGNLGVFGRALRDGILAAHYANRGIRPAINVYDTSGGDDIRSVYRDALADGAGFVIGPLARDRVDTLAESTLPVPVLALNRTTRSLPNPDLYQFGLAPEDEVIQVAEQVFAQGYKRPLVIAPANDWGERNVSTFADYWAGLGGDIVVEARFESERDYSELVKTTLRVDASEARGNALRRIIGVPFEFNERRRQDVDVIILFARSPEARGINPTLAFFYAENLPVYATSHVFDAGASRMDLLDLNRIRFCDSPWKLADALPIRQVVNAAWPDARGRLAPFYSLGVDAYRLYPRLPQLAATDSRVYGATGVLTVATGNTVKRELMWGQFRDGQVTAMPMILGAAVMNRQRPPSASPAATARGGAISSPPESGSGETGSTALPVDDDPLPLSDRSNRE